MNIFAQCADYDIDWDLSPEQAVTMYLEWGNNDWHATHAPVRSKNDVSVYFVVDTWEVPPVIRLVRRNSEQATDLFSLPLPPHLRDGWQKEYGALRGIFEPTSTIKDWLKKEIEKNTR